MKFTVTLFIFFFGIAIAFSQDRSTNLKQKTVAVTKTVTIDSVSINPNFFSITLKDSTLIDSTYYSVDFSKSLLTFNKPVEADSLVINYLKYPEYLTRTYQQFDEAIIVENNEKANKL